MRGVQGVQSWNKPGYEWVGLVLSTPTHLIGGIANIHRNECPTASDLLKRYGKVLEFTCGVILAWIT